MSTKHFLLSPTTLPLKIPHSNKKGGPQPSSSSVRDPFQAFLILCQHAHQSAVAACVSGAYLSRDVSRREKKGCGDGGAERLKTRHRAEFCRSLCRSKKSLRTAKPIRYGGFGGESGTQFLIWQQMKSSYQFLEWKIRSLSSAF